MLKKVFVVSFVVFSFLYGCSKSGTAPSQPAIDETKLTNQAWLWGGKHYPQGISLKFNSDKTGTQVKCVWYVEPYRYETTTFNWQKYGADSLAISNYNSSNYISFKMKVFTLNDTLLVTNNWVVGGPGISDTVRTYFTTK